MNRQTEMYLGHESQISGVEEVRLVGGRGDGMRLLQVRNGKGLEFTVSVDRCADLSRLSYRGGNYGYFSPCGYVHPSYYDGVGNGFLKSFTAGFLTTCGLNAVGMPCTDEGEELPLHGTIGNTPADHVWWNRTDRGIEIRATIRDERIFAHRLVLERTWICSEQENTLSLRDKVMNQGGEPYPVEILYHMNMGYPLLSEESLLYIPSSQVKPRNSHAAVDLESWNKMLPPTVGFEEQCYFHQFENQGVAAIYSPLLGTGLVIRFSPQNLPYFTQWKMMGVGDYALGLEPGNCHPDGRSQMRAEGALTILKPGEAAEYEVNLQILENCAEFQRLSSCKDEEEGVLC